jgi:hypothetical protein
MLSGLRVTASLAVTVVQQCIHGHSTASSILKPYSDVVSTIFSASVTPIPPIYRAY